MMLQLCSKSVAITERYGYHRKCYFNFTHKKMLASIKSKSSNEEATGIKRVTSRKRDRHGKFTYKSLKVAG